MAQPHERYGLRARRMVVLWTFRAPALCRGGHRALLSNALIDYTPIIPTTACHQSSYVETYSRCRGLAWHVNTHIWIDTVITPTQSAARESAQSGVDCW